MEIFLKIFVEKPEGSYISRIGCNSKSNNLTNGGCITYD